MSAGAWHPTRLLWSAPKGRTDAERQRLAAHMAACPGCRREAAALSSLARSLRAQGDLDHIPIEQLVRLHERDRSLSLVRRAALRAHLDDCAACREDLEALRLASRQETPAWRVEARAWAPALAAAVLILCVGVGIVGTIRSAAPPPRLPEVVLQAPRRGVEARPQVRAGRAHTFRILLPLDAGPGPWQVRFTSPGAGPLPMDAPRFEAAPDGTLTVTLPAPQRSGRQLLEVTSAGGPAPQPIVYLVQTIP